MNTGTRIAISAIGGFLVAILLFGAGHALALAHGFAGSERGSMMGIQSSECPMSGQDFGETCGFSGPGMGRY